MITLTLRKTSRVSSNIDRCKFLFCCSASLAISLTNLLVKSRLGRASPKHDKKTGFPF